MKFCLKMWKRPKFGIFFCFNCLNWLFARFLCKFCISRVNILKKIQNFQIFQNCPKSTFFPVFRDSTQPSKTICKITNTWNMSPIIKLNIIEYLFLLYINKQLQKKSIKKRNLTFYLCRANRPPLVVGVMENPLVV